MLAGIPPGAEIRFDGVAATIVSEGPGERVVEAPPGAVGWVEVSAVSGGEEVVLPDAFRYWPDGAGRVGAIGQVDFTRQVGGFWTSPAGDAASALLAFVAPADWALWRDSAASIGGCAYDRAPQPLPTAVDPGAAALELSAGGQTTSVRAAGPAGLYSDLGLVPAVDVVPGTVYALDPVAGGPDWPGFGVDGFVEVPPAFTVTAPNLGRPADPVDVGESFTLTWDGSGGDYALISLRREYYDPSSGWTDDGEVTCAVPDTGSFTVPIGSWPDWYADDFLHVKVGRVIETRAVLPHDGSEVAVAGIYWVYGGADTY